MNRLRTRLALSTSLLIFFTVSTVAFILAIREKRALRTRLDESSVAFAVLTAESIEDAYEAYGLTYDEELRETISQFSQALPALSRVEILDSKGEMLFASGESGVGSERGYLPADIIQRIGSSRLSMASRTEGGEEVLDIVYPDPESGLSVRYIVSCGPLRQQLRSVFRTFSLIALLSIVAGIGVAILLSRTLTVPLVRLVQAVEKARGEKSGEPTEVGSRHEVARIAQAFNSVCEELRTSTESSETVDTKLGKLDQFKSEFLANVSHELRTPLTSIKGYVDYMLQGKMGETTEAQQRGLEVVQRNLIRLIKRVESLLTLSKEGAPPDGLDVIPFSLGPVVEEILRGVEFESKGKGLVLELDIPDNLPPLLADREGVSQAVENLLSNAIKFTPEGGEIRVAAREVLVDHKRHIEVSISDTGIGIPRDELPRIFDRFHQIDSSSKRRYSGIGLGLAIVKQIVEKHSGRIEVESEEGKGTTFRLLLPAY